MPQASTPQATDFGLKSEAAWADGKIIGQVVSDFLRRASVRAIFVRALFVGLALTPLAGLRAAPQGNPEAAKVQNPVPSSPESIAAGKQSYTRYCANCHGLNGEGSPGNDLTPEAPDLTDKT